MLCCLLLLLLRAATQIHHDKIKKGGGGGKKEQRKQREGPIKRTPSNLDIMNIKNQSLAYKEWFASLGPDDYSQAHW